MQTVVCGVDPLPQYVLKNEMGTALANDVRYSVRIKEILAIIDWCAEKPNAEASLRTAVAEGGTRANHKGVEGGAAARTLSIDVPSTKEGIKADDESVDARIMADAGQPDAVAAMGEVAVEGPNLAAAGREHWGAGGANGDVAVTTNGWEEKEIDSQGDRECGRLLGKGEERGASTDGGRDVSARHPPPEGEWPGRSAAVEQASAPRRGGER